MTTLSTEALEALLQELPGWSVKDGALTASFTFRDFNVAFRFMALVAREAEAQHHHPTWTNTYNKVDVVLRTHDAGGAITERDAMLARAIRAAAEQFLTGRF